MDADTSAGTSADRLREDEVDEKIRRLRSGLEQAFDNKVGTLEDELAEMESKIDQLEDRVDDLEAENDELREKLDTLVGLAEDEQTTAEKRRQDVRQMLVNKAKARADRDDQNPGTVAWTASDIEERLEENGHGQLYPAQIYRLMDNLGDHTGFAHTENDDGVEVLRVSLPALTENSGTNNVSNDAGASPRGEMIDG